MRIISVTNQKGGCGKTTTAINLSAAFAARGKKVLLIDLDPQAHASFGVGAATQSADRTIYNVLTSHPEKQRRISECITNVAQQLLDIVPSNILLSTLEQEMKDKEDAVSRLYHILKESRLKYDYVVIDCPPSLGFLTFNALRTADQVIVPLDMSAYSLMGVGKLMGMLELVKVKLGHAPAVNALATLYDKRTSYSDTVLDQIEAFFKNHLFKTVIRATVTLKRAAAASVPVIWFDGSSNGARDYMSLADEILNADKIAGFEITLAAVAASGKAVEEALNAAPDRGDANLEFRRESVSGALKVEVPSQPLKIDNRKRDLLVGVEKAQPLPKPENRILEPEASKKEIAFVVNAPAAKDIYLVGDFNHWKINDEARLSRLDNGRWEKRVGLESGKYKYKFVVDGEWVLDAQNFEREQNSYGTFDSVLKV